MYLHSSVPWPKHEAAASYRFRFGKSTAVRSLRGKAEFSVDERNDDLCQRFLQGPTVAVLKKETARPWNNGCATFVETDAPEVPEGGLLNHGGIENTRLSCLRRTPLGHKSYHMTYGTTWRRIWSKEEGKPRIP